MSDTGETEAPAKKRLREKTGQARVHIGLTPAEALLSNDEAAPQVDGDVGLHEEDDMNVDAIVGDAVANIPASSTDGGAAEQEEPEEVRRAIAQASASSWATANTDVGFDRVAPNSQVALDDDEEIPPHVSEEIHQDRKRAGLSTDNSSDGSGSKESEGACLRKASRATKYSLYHFFRCVEDSTLARTSFP